MKRQILLTSMVACYLTGCVSVYHIDSAIPDDALATTPDIVGTWYASDSSRVVITVAEAGAHRLEYRDSDGTTGSLYGRLGRLGAQTVLEVWPALGDVDDTWPVGRFLLVVDVTSAEIRTRHLKGDSVQAALTRDDAGFPHLIQKDAVILTAPTRALREKLMQYLTRPGFLEEPELYRRARNP